MFYLFFFLLCFRLGQQFLFSARQDYREADRVRINTCLTAAPREKIGGQTIIVDRIVINNSSSEQFSAGDCLEIRGRIVSKNGIFFLDRPEFHLVGKENWWGRVKGWAFRCQEKAVNVFRSWLPEPQAGLLAGIVLGSREALSSDFYNKFKNLGLSHLVVASGYNLTMISRWPVDFFAWIIGRQPALVTGTLLVWLYCLFAGWSAPVVRAGIVVSLVYLARLLGRKFDPWQSLLLASGLMLISRPQLLVDVSFQLSMAAMAGLLVFKKKWQRLRKFPVIGKPLAESLGCQLMVLPILAFHFGSVSWAAALIGGLVLPLVPLLMTLGLVSLAGVLWLPLAMPFLFLSYPVLLLLTATVDLFSRIPGLNISVRFPFWLVPVYYLLLWLFLVRERKCEK